MSQNQRNTYSTQKYQKTTTSLIFISSTFSYNICNFKKQLKNNRSNYQLFNQLDTLEFGCTFFGCKVFDFQFQLKYFFTKKFGQCNFLKAQIHLIPPEYVVYNFTITQYPPKYRLISPNMNMKKIVAIINYCLKRELLFLYNFKNKQLTKLGNVKKLSVKSTYSKLQIKYEIYSFKFQNYELIYQVYTVFNAEF
eukprot:TRINITY_DN5972_c0_g1_i3.p2 TRINITY_DN5972_c0_g1~~TRINITY_DN5972_c0_g1_i3.p2  ORF type:complete len:194 (-),score=-13.05 TRINITY_DN5972_c0_g1_i3:71-652(-)